MYKVTYDTVFINKDGTLGNVWQNGGEAYMDCSMPQVESLLCAHLKPSRNHPIISKVERVEGFIVPAVAISAMSKSSTVATPLGRIQDLLSGIDEKSTKQDLSDCLAYIQDAVSETLGN